MMKGTFVDDNMSNLTSASNEANLSSSNRNQIGTMYPQQSFASVSNDQTQPPTKKKRNLPGNPDPEAEVIALSPRALLATNRFICEVCNKGFQRDQNLQLHRRGHNLPWKLKQRANKELIRKKVYVCPEPSCVHHDPSRALGDLTGIKKHFSRKHGEKKWKCEKCSKRYAVQSDWKAHSKICGTREYRCDCGTLFSRRDSFITHRAFCDALAEETARSTTMSILPQNPQASSNLFNFQQNLSTHVLKSEQDFNPRPDIPPWLDRTIMHPNPNPNLTPAHMSATALLQKAAQMGATMSKGGGPHETQFGAHQAHHICTTTGSGNAGLSLHGEMGTGFGANVTSGCMDQVGATVDTMMGSLSSASGFEGSTFEEAYNGMLSSRVERKFKENLPQGGGNDGLTRDFLGLRGFPHRDFVNMGGFGDISTSPSSYHQRNNQNQAPWQG